MKYSLGISPCPNDTFIFYALIENKINHNFDFKVHFEDIGVLNRMAFNGELDFVKMSFNAYSKLQEQYRLIDAGGALGNNCGPLLLSKDKVETISNEMTVAIPGENTTANFLLSMAYPNLKNKEEVLFSEIEESLTQKEFDLGLVIHESRFTYEKLGLHKVMDLGQFWEETTKCPIPLGGIFSRNQISTKVHDEFTLVLRASLDYAYANEEEILEYCSQYAQEMDTKVMKSHIDLYVNEYSYSYKGKGNEAIQRFLKESSKLK